MKKTSKGKMMRAAAAAFKRGAEEEAMMSRANPGVMPQPAAPAPGMAPGMKKGGAVKEPKAMVKKEIEFFKKKGAPKKMIEHEKKEAKQMGYAKGGHVRGDGLAQRGKTRGRMC